MKITGNLRLHHGSDDYLMFFKGRNININDVLNLQLLENMEVKIRCAYTGQVLFDSSGRLVKERTSPMYYEYHIGSDNFDKVLWNNVGRRLEVCIRNISKY